MFFPVMYEIYKGSSGKVHGDKKETVPAPKATHKVKSVPIFFPPHSPSWKSSLIPNKTIATCYSLKNSIRSTTHTHYTL